MVRNFPVYAHSSMKNMASQQRWAGKVGEHYHPDSPSAMKMPFFKAYIPPFFQPSTYGHSPCMTWLSAE
ncbi:hypothetical protein ALP72_05599 [Pseudomonas coronafaciens pv. coronafaciens]|nr:hypothetical protein ALP72_05599 [Pseudomonas coronafaciens pv. coronafaciens]